MRDMVTCFSEHAVRVSETTCSSYVHQNQPCIPANHLNLTPALQNAVVYSYKTTTLEASSQKQFLVTVTWCRNNLGQGGLSINFGDDPSNSFKLNTFSRLFRKKKGQKFIEFNSSKIEVLWDLSAATYHSSPEPVDGYYILVSIDQELALALGDLAQEAATKRLKTGNTSPRAVLVSRREHYSGNTLYCTKAQFCDSGVTHDIVVRCSSVGNGKVKQPVLYVNIDKKTVMKVRRLQWNFRGNQTVFVDGLLIDLMWDVHDWFFNPVSGSAVFMFKPRSGGDSRLWLEEKLAHKDEDKLDFSLLLYASKHS